MKLKKQFKKALTSTNLIISAIALMVMSGLMLYGYNVFLKGTSFNSAITQTVGSTHITDELYAKVTTPITDGSMNMSTDVFMTIPNTNGDTFTDDNTYDALNNGNVVFGVKITNGGLSYGAYNGSGNIVEKTNNLLENKKSSILQPYFVINKNDYLKIPDEYQKTLNIIKKINVSNANGDSLEAYIIGPKTAQ